jgi:hypothetical protein
MADGLRHASQSREEARQRRHELLGPLHVWQVTAVADDLQSTA